MSSAPPGPRAARLLPPALLLVLVAVAWGFTLRMPFTGVDAWPILAQAKAALADPTILFTQRYLEGLWEGARFWRPGLTAYTALQYAALGDQPFGYHLARLALLAVTAALAGTLAARHGAAPRLAWTVAALVYALHPLQAETVPVTSRDADTLATALVLGALVALTGRRSRWRGWRLVLGVALALLAPTVKEPALLAPLLAIVVAGTVAGRSRPPCRGDRQRRPRRGARRTAPATASRSSARSAATSATCRSRRARRCASWRRVSSTTSAGGWPRSRSCC